MATVLYRFDSVEAFPVLSTYTTARGPVLTRVVGEDEEAALALGWNRRGEDPAEVTVMLGLPVVTIDGQAERLELDLSGDLTGCGVFLEAADSSGRGMTYELQGEGGAAPRTWSADARQPSELWEERSRDDPAALVLPVQLHRLGFAIAAECRRLDIRLVRLRVTGEVRLGAGGIA